MNEFDVLFIYTQNKLFLLGNQRVCWY